MQTNGPCVTVADGRIIVPTKKALLPLPIEFTRNAKIAYSFNNLQSGTLISIGQLCDDDCIAIFSKYDVKIIKNNKILIRGRRTQNGLWKMPIARAHSKSKCITTAEHAHAANGVIQLDRTKGDLAQYYGATLFNPVKSSIIRAINRYHFTSWPGMTGKMMRKHLPQRIATAQGHMDQEFKNLRTTKNDLEADIAPDQDPDNIKTNDIMCYITTMEATHKSYSDQTGKFPITSSRGHKYIFVFYHYDTNTILGIAIKSRNTSDLCTAWYKAFELFKSHGEAPNIHYPIYGCLVPHRVI